MDTITRGTIQDLLEADGHPLVSIYLPTHRAGRETSQDPIRLKNLIDAAKETLVNGGLRSPEADELLGEAAALEDDYDFWQHQEDGLAVFIGPDRTETFRVPVTVPELATVGDSFHLKPLWPVVGTGKDLFYLLALSRNLVRLLWIDRYRVGEVRLPKDVPQSLAEALWFQDPEKQLQHHGSDRAGRGDVVAAFHGHGVPEERGEARLEAFLRAVDDGLAHLVDPDTPLLLAGVEEITAVFRKVSKRDNLLEETVAGNPDRLESHELHEAALASVEPHLRRRFEADKTAFVEADDLAVSDLEEGVRAALDGRVESVIVPVGTHIWGRLSGDGYSIEVHEKQQAGDRDLLDLAASAAWLTGARVHAVDPDSVPGPGPLAAVLRYRTDGQA